MKIEGDKKLHFTGLMYAARYNLESILDILLENGADVNKFCNDHFSSSLIFACRYANI